MIFQKVSKIISQEIVWFVQRIQIFCDNASSENYCILKGL